MDTHRFLPNLNAFLPTPSLGHSPDGAAVTSAGQVDQEEAFNGHARVSASEDSAHPIGIFPLHSQQKRSH